MEWLSSLVSGKSLSSSTNNNGDDKISPQKNNDNQVLSDRSDEEVYREVVEKLKGIYDPPVDQNGMTILEVLEKRLEEIIDQESFVHSVEGNKDLNYEEFQQEMKKLAESTPLQLVFFRYKHVQPGVIDIYVVHFASKLGNIEIRGKQYYSNPQGKIIKAMLQRKVTPLSAGQTVAVPQHRPMGSSGVSERTFAKRVQELPSVLQGNILGQRHGMRPVLLEYNLLKIRFKIIEGPFDLFKKQRIVELTTVNENEPYANGAKFVYKKRQFPFYETLVLYSGGPRPDPVCYAERKGRNRMVLYGTQPLVPGSHKFSKPMLLNLRDFQSDLKLPLLDSWVVGRDDEVVAFYPWFEIIRAHKTYKSSAASSTKDSCFSFVNVLATREDDASIVEFEPLYKVITTRDHKKAPHSSVFEDYYHDTQVGVFQSVGKDMTRRGEVNVAPGADPALMVMASACVELMQE